MGASTSEQVIASPTSYTVLATRSFLKEDANDENSTTEIKFTQYRGIGQPPTTLGGPGDLFFDLSPKAYRLWARYSDGWREWKGIARELSEAHYYRNFRHPLDDSRILWFYKHSFEWRKLNKELESSRSKLFRRRQWIEGTDFVTAHQFIEQYGIGRESSGRRRRADVGTDSDDNYCTDDTETASASTATYNLRQRAQKRARTYGHQAKPQSQEDEPNSSGGRNTSRSSEPRSTYPMPRASSNGSHFIAFNTNSARTRTITVPSPQPHPFLGYSAPQLTDVKDNQLPGHDASRSSNQKPASSAHDQTTKNSLQIAPTTNCVGSSSHGVHNPQPHPSLGSAPGTKSNLTKGEEEAQRRAQDHEKLMSRHRLYQTKLMHRHQEVARESEEVMQNAKRVREELDQAKRDAFRRAEEVNRQMREREAVLGCTERLEGDVKAKEEEIEQQRKETEEMEKEIRAWNEIY
ncbi:hypothetical protein Hypma_001966 [Hypsizygus marmoreus]|uniref:Uncharacterized protein n=1 Tax=Hypsizygus marmoreus TaxID=39966 RepID=A0A369J5T7_HYPMA|nr:hypothetical protein Hypma_001966 [Hypsizygus marmoreus]